MSQVEEVISRVRIRTSHKRLFLTILVTIYQIETTRFLVLNNQMVRAVIYLIISGLFIVALNTRHLPKLNWAMYFKVDIPEYLVFTNSQELKRILEKNWYEFVLSEMQPKKLYIFHVNGDPNIHIRPYTMGTFIQLPQSAITQLDTIISTLSLISKGTCQKIRESAIRTFFSWLIGITALSIALMKAFPKSLLATEYTLPQIAKLVTLMILATIFALCISNALEEIILPPLGQTNPEDKNEIKNK